MKSATSLYSTAAAAISFLFEQYQSLYNTHVPSMTKFQNKVTICSENIVKVMWNHRFKDVSDMCQCSGLAKNTKTWDFCVKTSVLSGQNIGFFEPCCTSAETIQTVQFPT